MAFAVMVPVICTGAWAEKMTFNAFLIFVFLWPIFVYYPLAHWVWNENGWLRVYGTVDFAGGITIHTSSGVAAFIVSCFLARR
jgi:Amt family ammonium transporter